MAIVLVVDDSPILQRITAYTLNRAGYTVVGALGGAEALSYLTENPVDLIIVDLSMPQMDGLTLVHALRAAERTRRLPIIMLTASGQEQDRVKAQAEGVNAFLTKPTSSQELVDAVSRLQPPA